MIISEKNRLSRKPFFGKLLTVQDQQYVVMPDGHCWLWATGLSVILTDASGVPIEGESAFALLSALSKDKEIPEAVGATKLRDLAMDLGLSISTFLDRRSQRRDS